MENSPRALLWTRPAVWLGLIVFMLAPVGPLAAQTPPAETSPARAPKTDGLRKVPPPERETVKPREAFEDLEDSGQLRAEPPVAPERRRAPTRVLSDVYPELSPDRPKVAGQAPRDHPDVFILPHQTVATLERAAELGSLDSVYREVLRGEAALFGAPMGILVPVGSASFLTHDEIPEKDAIYARIQERQRHPSGVSGALVGMDLIQLEAVLTTDDLLGGAMPLDPDLLTVERDKFLDDPDRKNSEVENSTGTGLFMVGDLRDAEPLLHRSYAIRLATRGPRDPLTLQAAEILCRLYEVMGKDKKAARIRDLIDDRRE